MTTARRGKTGNAIAPVNDNLRLWEALEATDPAFARRFDKGAFRGNAVNATYNMKRLTALLGPVGFKWGWHVEDDQLNRFGGDDPDHPNIVHVLRIRIWFQQPDGSVRTFDSVGTTFAARWVGRDRMRRYDVDDEYAKKSLTDALSKAMLALGASADVWFGYFDDNKYVAQRRAEVEELARPKGGAGDDEAHELARRAGKALTGVPAMDERALRRTLADWSAAQEDGRPLSDHLADLDREFHHQLRRAIARRARASSMRLNEPDRAASPDDASRVAA